MQSQQKNESKYIQMLVRALKAERSIHCRLYSAALTDDQRQAAENDSALTKQIIALIFIKTPFEPSSKTV